MGQTVQLMVTQLMATWRPFKTTHFGKFMNGKLIKKNTRKL